MLREWLDQVPNEVQLGVLLTLLWFWLGTERLVVGKTHRRIVAMKDKQIADKEEENKYLREALAISTTQVDKLVDKDNLVLVAIDSVREEARRRS